jgi:hypothetical protein
VAYWALNYAISRFPSEFNDVSVLKPLILLGLMPGRIIEDFLASRCESDREKARQILLEAERCSKDPQLFEVFRNSIQPPLMQAVSYDTFKENMTDLMIDLRRGLLAYLNLLERIHSFECRV